MMYPFMTLNDDTEIVHSEMKPDGRVKVYIERPDEKYGFRHATCWLPDYTWEDVYQFSDEEINRLQKIVESTAHLIMEFSQEGGFENASTHLLAVGKKPNLPLLNFSWTIALARIIAF